MTDYSVFRFQKVFGDSQISGGAWVKIGAATARSASSAIREVLDSADDPESGAEYVAVPERSWKPVSVKVETKTALKFS